MLLHEVKAAIAQTLELLQGAIFSFSASATDYNSNNNNNNSNHSNQTSYRYNNKNYNKRQYNKSSLSSSEQQRFQTLHCTHIDKRIHSNGTHALSLIEISLSTSSSIASEGDCSNSSSSSSNSSSSSSNNNSSSNSSSSSSGYVRAGCNMSVIELQKDDLVVIVKRAASAGTANSRES